MKTLIIMRHAKTEEGKINQRDFDRELITRGKNDAMKISEWLKKKYAPIDEVYASSAMRTKQTADIVSEECGGYLNLMDSLYHADANDILNQINKTNEKVKLLLMVGHNPAVSNLVTFLSNKVIELKPSDVVVFEIENKTWDKKLNIISFKHHSVY